MSEIAVALSVALVLIAALGSCTFLSYQANQDENTRIQFRSTCLKDGHSAEDCERIFK